MRYLLTFVLLILCLAASSQDLPNSVATKFNSYQEGSQVLKTAIVLSQEKYMPGDTVFFTAWFMTHNGQLVKGDQILNLDMINSSGDVVQHILFRVRDGVGANQLIIDANAEQGSYVMCAYNDAMRDGDPKYAYRKNITVVKRNAVLTSSSAKENETQLINVDDSSMEDLNVTANIPGYRGQDLVLAVTSGGHLYFTAAFSLKKSDVISIKLPRSELPQGWIELSVISKNGIVAATRNFFIRSSIRTRIELTSDTVNTRQQIFASVNITDATGKPLSIPLSVSVVNANVATEVENYEINEPPFISWTDILKGKPPVQQKPSKLITVAGEVYFGDTNQPVPKETIVCGFMKRNGFSFETRVEDNGRIEMVFLDFFGADNMFYYAEHDGKELKNVKIRWITKEIDHAPALRANETGQVDSYATFVEKKRMVDRSFNFFSNINRDSVKSALVPLEMEFEKIGAVVNFNEYKIFPTMSETIREIVPRLGERKVGGEDILRVDLSGITHEGFNFKANANPLFIIDGALTKSSKHLLSLDPASIVSIRVIYTPQDLQKFLPVGKNGIVVVKTKTGLGKREIKDESLPITGLSAPISFIPMKPGRPEFRSTIAWLPSIKTDANGYAAFSFNTSDDTGKMKIKVAGIYGGELFTAEKEIIVTFGTSH